MSAIETMASAIHHLADRFQCRERPKIVFTFEDRESAVRFQRAIMEDRRFGELPKASENGNSFLVCGLTATIEVKYTIRLPVPR